jgi:hypothetical protein
VDIVHSSKSIFNFPRVVDISNTENHVIACNINNNISTIAPRFSLGSGGLINSGGLECQKTSIRDERLKPSTEGERQKSFPIDERQKPSIEGERQKSLLIDERQKPANGGERQKSLPRDERQKPTSRGERQKSLIGLDSHKSSNGLDSHKISTPPSVSSTVVPSFVPFNELLPLYRLVNTLRGKGMFSIGSIKRALKKAMATISSRSHAPIRPHAFDVIGMFDPIMFQSGRVPLSPGDSPLKVSVMDAYHVASCPICVNSVDPSCEWYVMRQPLVYGWIPPIDIPSIKPLYDATGPDGNHKSASIFPATIQKELDAQVELGICTPFKFPVPNALIAPLGASLRSSDKAKALAITGIKITDQTSIDTVNSILVSKAIPKIKVRPIHDATSVGINAASYVAHFSNSGIDDAIPLISQNCFMGKLDVSRFFHNFPLAPEIRYLFWVFFAYIFYQMNRVIFGLGNAPYFTSAYGAEIRRWILHEKIPGVHYCDDHFTAGQTYALVMAYLKAIGFIFEAIGFSIAMDKFEIGQRLVYLGVLFDSIKMTMSFDPLSAAGFHSELSLSLTKITAGRHLTHGEIRHIAGKLSHYSQVCQSGRCHIRWWWIYLHYGSSLSQKGTQHLLADSEWWLDLLAVWKESDFSGIEYPIFSSSFLMDNNMIVILQSDASGPHGFGYISGYIDDLNPSFYSARWLRGEEDICDNSSHFAELRALSHYVTTTTESNKVLIWVSDSQSAVYSANNGSCHEQVSMDLISSVLSMCDIKHIYIIALWIPREINLLPDYLSHLAYYINSEATAGRISELPTESAGSTAYSS